MAGKRILDIATILNVLREVAKKNLELRTKQIELYNKTSSLAKAIHSQNERLSETIKVSTLFANRQNESTVSENRDKTSEAAVGSLKNSQSILGSKSSTSNSGSISDEIKSSIERKSNNSLNSSSTSEEQLKQPFTDEYEKHNIKFSQVFGEIQDDKNVLIDESLRPSNFNEQFIHDEEKISENLNINIFHSSRVARSLGGNTQGYRSIGSNPKEIKNITNDRAKPAIACEKNHDQTSKASNLTSENSVTTHLELSQPLKIDTISTSDLEIPRTETESNTTISKLRESKVPASRAARLWNYGGLAAGILGGAVSEGFRRAVGSGDVSGSYILNTNNVNRLVTKLSRMRGAALKLGQMISFQDSSMLPNVLQDVLQRVQDRADYMPSYQRDKVLMEDLGSDWRQIFSSFDEIPIAAASIGQVHRAVLKSNGVEVAVKVQYPGVSKSIDSDLKNLEILLTASKLLPKGLYLDKTIANARIELAWECDYIREAECARRFEQYLHEELETFVVPKVFSEASGKQVLTSEFMNGVAITKIKNLSQEQKDWIGTQILRLCLREIIEFRFMQTDPNWTNFLYNQETHKLELLDFGASREYSQDFISKYTKLLVAASRLDKESLEKLSIDLGYLTGFESKTMLDAHINSVLTLAEPFLDTSPHLYDFRNQTITDRVRELIPVMIRERLSPPPEETYSLHRKLSGAFLLCARLGSRVPCRKLFEESFGKAKLI
ncbi:hypothetical protein HI914_00830 [Erysiphe necator]|nr:hypothetical protein HI914_00830 [Erysiphe necator]